MARNPKPVRTAAAASRTAPPSLPPAARVIAIVALLSAVVLVVWAVSAPVGDLFMSLAGGRDVVQSRLGHLDDWSFMTPGRIWIDQNWLSHLLIYDTWHSTGESGLLVLKALLLAAIAGIAFLLARSRGAGTPAAATISAGVVLACFRFVALRPNLLTLVFVPLTIWVLHSAERDRRRLAWSVPLMALWANTHGGFVFGLAIVALWVLCTVLDDARRFGLGAIAKDWPLLVTAIACVAACAISPFGLRNLTHPLVIASSKAWRQVPEWLPLLTPSPLAFPWEFFVVLAATLGFGAAGLLGLAGRRPPRKRTPTTEPGALASATVDWLVLALATAMAFQSRRFVPLAILACASLLASQMARMDKLILRAVTAIAFVGIAIATAVLGWQSSQAYRPDNPIRRGSSLFDRMHAVSDFFPLTAGRFLAANEISGNAFAEWEWEGYLRWVAPRVRLFAGGRAQQVYPDDVLELSSRIQNSDDGPRVLQETQAHLLIVSETPRYAPLVSRLTSSHDWAFIFDDGRSQVLADSRAEATSPLVKLALAGQLSYPTEMSRALSLAVCRWTAEAPPDTAAILAALQEANRSLPTARAYDILGMLADTPKYRPGAILYLEQEAARLDREQPRGKGAQQVRISRIMIQQVLAGLNRDALRNTESLQAQDRAMELSEEAAAVKAAWR